MQEIVTLFDGLHIAINEMCKFTTDSILLSHFANPSPKDKALDLCSGSGIIPLLWFGENQIAPQNATCVEIIPDIAKLIEQSVKLNGISDKMNVICGDLKELSRPNDGAEYTLITCNPPYFRENTGKIGDCANARQEIFCTIDDVCCMADKQLKYGGRLCVCQRPNRLTDVLVAMRKYKIEPKKIRIACHSAGREPFLILIEGKKGAKSEVKFLPTLYLEENNRPSDEQKEIYKLRNEVDHE